MDLRFPVWKPAPRNDGPSRVRIHWSNTICLVTVERGKSCDTIGLFKLKIRYGLTIIYQYECTDPFSLLETAAIGSRYGGVEGVLTS